MKCTEEQLEENLSLSDSLLYSPYNSWGLGIGVSLKRKKMQRYRKSLVV